MSLKTIHGAQFMAARLRNRGVILRLIDGELRVDDPNGTITSETLATIAASVGPLIAVLIGESHYERIRCILRMECKRIDISTDVVDRLPEAELDAVNDQLGIAAYNPDGRGNPLLHSLAEFYLKEISR